MLKTAKTTKAILGGIWRLGRGTATVMGLASPSGSVEVEPWPGYGQSFDPH